MMVVTMPDTPAGVEQLAMNVARLLGAKPMLTDPVEADGIMTTAMRHSRGGADRIRTGTERVEGGAASPGAPFNRHSQRSQV
jgi:hypothetical protein